MHNLPDRLRALADQIEGVAIDLLRTVAAPTPAPAHEPTGQPQPSPGSVVNDIEQAIQAAGGQITRREWQRRGNGKTAEDAYAELDQLVKAGLAYWHREKAANGRYRYTLVLNQQATHAQHHPNWQTVQAAKRGSIHGQKQNLSIYNGLIEHLANVGVPGWTQSQIEHALRRHLIDEVIVSIPKKATGHRITDHVRERLLDRHRTLAGQSPPSDDNAASHPTPTPPKPGDTWGPPLPFVVEVTKRGQQLIGTYRSQAAAAKATGVPIEAVNQIVNGHAKDYKGLTFRNVPNTPERRDAIAELRPAESK